MKQTTQRFKLYDISPPKTLEHLSNFYTFKEEEIKHKEEDLVNVLLLGVGGGGGTEIQRKRIKKNSIQIFKLLNFIKYN